MNSPVLKYGQNICLAVAASLLIAGIGCQKAESKEGDGAAPKAAAGLAEGKLAGLYVRQQSVPMMMGGRMTFVLQREFFYFFPDGHVLFFLPASGLKEHPTAEDFTAFKDTPAKDQGTYAVKGAQITFTRDGGKTSSEPFSIPKAGDDSVLQIGAPSVIGSVKALPFKDGQKIDGSYQFDGTVYLVNNDMVFNVNDLTFHADGTLGSNQLTGLDTKGIKTSVGSSGVTTQSQATSAGTYKLSEYTLEKTIDGKTEKLMIFRWAGDDKPEAPGLLCIAGRVYSRHESKK